LRLARISGPLGEASKDQAGWFRRSEMYFDTVSRAMKLRYEQVRYRSCGGFSVSYQIPTDAC
jgi:hypothetical protein